MRRLLIAAALLGVSASRSSRRHARILGAARLVPRRTRAQRASIWEGYYIGAQAGVGQSDMNFTGATRTLAAACWMALQWNPPSQVSQWPLLGKTSRRRRGLGWLHRLQQPVGRRRDWRRNELHAWQVRRRRKRFDGALFIDALGYTQRRHLRCRCEDVDYGYGHAACPRRLCRGSVLASTCSEVSRSDRPISFGQHAFTGSPSM